MRGEEPGGHLYQGPEDAAHHHVSSDLLRKLLRSLERELPDAIGLRERLHAAAEPSHEEHLSSLLVGEALGGRAWSACSARA